MASGALAVLVLAVSGLVIWWPGVHAWRRSTHTAARRELPASRLALAQHGWALDARHHSPDRLERGLF